MHFCEDKDKAPEFKKIAQSKMHTLRGLDEGCCAACLLGEDGCDEDDRAGVMGKCGLSHQGPKDQQAQFCDDATKTAGLKVTWKPSRNCRFWSNSPSSHSASEAKRSKRSQSPAPEGDGDKSE